MQNFLCLYSYHAYFILPLKSEKNVLQKEIEDWAFEACQLTKETSSWFLLTGLLKMTYARSYVHGSWIFIKRSVFKLIFAACLTQTSKITVTNPKSVKRT